MSLRVESRVDVNMMSSSGIRATGSGSGDYVKKIILKDAATYGPWKAKISSILDAEDVWEIVNGTETEPDELPEVAHEADDAAIHINDEAVEKRQVEIKAFRKRAKKAASLITQTVDDSIVMSLDVHQRDPALMWEQLANDYNTVTPAQLSTARRNFLNFEISEEESYLEIKQRYNELLRKLIVQKGTMSVEDRLDTLLGALPEKYDILRETFFAQTEAPTIDFIWDRMFDIESTEKRRAAQSGGSGMMGSGDGYYFTRGRGSFRGRGGTSGRGRVAGRGSESRTENCFRCGESDHWSRECPRKDSVCTWCSGVGHIERTCYSKANGAARGGKAGGSGMRGRGRGTRGVGRGGHAKFGEVEEEQGYAEVLFAEINLGEGDGDGEEAEWVCDSGASHHMTGDITLFDNLETIPSDFHLKQIKGRVAIDRWGVVRLSTDKADGKKGKLELHEVLYMPGMRVNIFSLQKIREKACSYSFEGEPQPGKVFPILNQKGKQIATMRETSKARPTLICERVTEAGKMEGEVLGGKGIQMELLHKRLGHTSQSGMERLVREQLVRGLEEGIKGDFGMCRGCKLGKSSEKSHPRKAQEYRAKEPLELLHTDIAGPFCPKAIEGGGQYNLVIIDDFSRKSWTLPLKRKSDTKVALKEWIAVHENEVGKKVKVMRSDNGGEYIDASLETWLKEHGIQHQTIPARSPQSNGVAERMNRTLQDRARSMLVGAGLGGGFWVEAISTASYIRNRGPVAGLSRTPDELWSGKTPTVKHLRAYGSKAYVSLEKFKRKGKMGITKWEGVIVGYPTGSVGYRVWDPVRGKVFNVGVPDVDESVAPGWWRKEGGEGGVDEVDGIKFPDLDDFTQEGVQTTVQVGQEPSMPALVEDSSDDENGGGDANEGEDDDWGPDDDSPVIPVHGGPLGGDAVEEDEDQADVEPRHSDREKRGVPPLRYIEMYLAAAAEEEVKQSPQSVQEALGSPQKEKWQEAMDSEMKSLRENGVYELVDKPAGKKIVKSKWVLRVKTNAKGGIEKFKARVVAKGYSQVEGVDYDQTFSPTVRFESIRQMVALGTSKNMHMHQMDVTTAFLYAPLEEEVYMEQPEGTVRPGDEKKVMRLLKCLYGLKQSPRQWNILIDTVLKQLGFKRLKSDFGIYVKGEGEDAVYIALYVDDLFLVGRKLGLIKEVKDGLCGEFKMKDLGEAKFLLGIEIRRQANGDVFLVQERYARDVLKRFNMEGCKSVSTPLELGSQLDTSQQPITDEEKRGMVDVPYRSAIGSLMYLATCTRPDLAASVSELSRFNQNPGIAHWEGVKHVLRYVKGTVGEGLLYKRGAQVEVWGYSDSGHAGDKETSRGRSGYVFISAGAAISWRSSLMKLVTHSSCESEYVGLSEAGNEAVYLSQLQGEMRIGKQSVLLLGDNESSLKLAMNPVFHQRSKHIRIKYHSLRDRVEEGLIELCKIDTGLNAADMLTKHVGVGALKTCKGLSGMIESG